MWIEREEGLRLILSKFNPSMGWPADSRENRTHGAVCDVSLPTKTRPGFRSSVNIERSKTLVYEEFPFVSFYVVSNEKVGYTVVAICSFIVRFSSPERFIL